MIVEKINMVELEMLSNIEKQSAKSRSLSNFSTAVFRGFPIVIVIRDFYQYLLVAPRSFWGKPQTEENYNDKTLWLFFSSVITLIE